MELILIMTKTVCDQAEGESFAAQVRSFVANNPALNNPTVRVEMEIRDKIES